MYKFLFLILAVTASSVLANNPEQAFENLVDAMYAADAESFRECLSTESVAMVDMMLVMMKLKPEDAALEISSKLGVEVTREELMGWTGTDLLSMVLSSPGFVSELPPRRDIVVTSFEVNGDSSIVFFTVNQLPGPFQIAMIKNGEKWKLDQSVIQAEL
jgi:hypothetical protein